MKKDKGPIVCDDRSRGDDIDITGVGEIYLKQCHERLLRDEDLEDLRTHALELNRAVDEFLARRGSIRK